MKKYTSGDVVKYDSKECKVITRSKDFSTNKISYVLEGIEGKIPEEFLQEINPKTAKRIKDLKEVASELEASNEELKQKFALDLIDSETDESEEDEDEEEEEEEDETPKKAFKRTKGK